MKEDGARKVERYRFTSVDRKKNGENVAFVKLSMRALGLICRDSDENGILQELKSIGLSVLESKNITRENVNICIRSKY